MQLTQNNIVKIIIAVIEIIGIFITGFFAIWAAKIHTENNKAIATVTGEGESFITLDSDDNAADVMLKLWSKNEELRESNDMLSEKNEILQREIADVQKTTEQTQDEKQKSIETLESKVKELQSERDELQKKYNQAVSERDKLTKSLQGGNADIIGAVSGGVALASLSVFNEKSYWWGINSGGKEDTLGYDYSNTESYIVLGMYDSWDPGYAEYFIDGKYTKLIGNIAPHSSASGERTSTVQIYGDDVLLYESKAVSVRTDVFSFELDESKMSGVRFLRIVQCGNTEIPLLLTDWTLS